MKTIENCLICNKSSFTDFLETKDFLVTKEKFKIVECNSCGFHFTNPIPYEDKVARYYESKKYVSHNENKKGLINIIYNIVRKWTTRQKVKIVRNEAKGKKLLDIGSGSGHFLKHANKSSLQGFGIEVSSKARRFALKKNKVNSVGMHDFFKIERASQDVITMWHVLEHIYELKKYLEKIHEILKIDGKLIIAVPNMEAYDAQYYKSYWAAYDVPRHLYHFKEVDISRLLMNFGFELKKVIPMKFDAYYISMLSEQRKTRLFFIGFFIGLLSNLKAQKFGYSSQIYVFEKSSLV